MNKIKLNTLSRLFRKLAVMTCIFITIVRKLFTYLLYPFDWLLTAFVRGVLWNSSFRISVLCLVGFLSGQGLYHLVMCQRSIVKMILIIKNL